MKRAFNFFILLIVFLLFQNCGQFSAKELTNASSTVDSPRIQNFSQEYEKNQYTSLFDNLLGFAKETTGGLGGEIYTVNKKGDDANEFGTLRYGIERIKGKVWIVFDKSVFPPNQKKAIYLSKALRIERDNVTIDGRGSHILIRRKFKWKDVDIVKLERPGSYTCRKKSGTSFSGGMLIIRSAKNIIISHLEFEPIYIGDPDIPPQSSMDKECFGDLLSVFNVASAQETKTYDRIWINNSTFSNCPDGCLDITRSSHKRRTHISISNNLFKDANKVMLISPYSNLKYGLLLSIYNNRFQNTVQRHPSIGNAIAHIFNNLFENWNLYGIGHYAHSRIMVEENVFIDGNNRAKPFSIAVNGEQGFLYARRNQLFNISNKEDYESKIFPSSREEGGPWYYENISMQSFSNLSQELVKEYFFQKAGWQNQKNDMRKE